MVFADRLCLPFAFDPTRLEADLERLAGGDWIRHFVTQNYEGDWSVIALRAAEGATHPVMTIYSDPNAKAFADTPALAHTSYFAEVLAQFACPLEAVRLMRLAPGSTIKPHRDHDLAYEAGAVRLHVPITTNAQVDFRLNGTPVAMTPGSIWYLRLADEHSVANRGTRDRVHLVIDTRPNAWLMAQLETASVTPIG